MTQLTKARQGIYTDKMALVDECEETNPSILKQEIAQGRIVIPSNPNHAHQLPVGIGKGLRIKVNANIGASPAKASIDEEVKKLESALKAGADTIMDLTILKDSGLMDEMRRTLISKCKAPFGTVPIYQAAVESGNYDEMSIEKYLSVFEKHAKDGVDFATVHAGITLKSLSLLEKRVMGVVSRGGSFLVHWMRKNNKENFLYTYFDDILSIAYAYDVTISLGDGLRPGALADASDKAQLEELRILGELAERCRDKGVQVMIEGPGHLPLNEIRKNIVLEKRICKQAPFYVLGPLPTDIATGYDDVAGAIGGALAGYYGADFLCYLTPKEHIGLPGVDDVRRGVMITKLAAHIADIARGNLKAKQRDYEMSIARSRLDWDEMQSLALDAELFKELRSKECRNNPELEKVKSCSMCGEYCALKVNKDK